MALVLADRVKETTTTTGTATYTLAGANSGFESFASIGDGNTTYYACTDGTDFEVGIGTYTASGTTLARTTILQSSNSDAAVSWSAGDKTIFCCQPAEKAVYLDASGNIAAFNGSNLTNVDASQLDSQAPTYYLNYNNFTNTPTIPTNNNELTNGAGYITSADGGNAQTLDSLDSLQFLRSDTADVKTSGDLTFLDNVKAVFGSGSDLKIFHDGNDSLISDTGTGSLFITGSNAITFQSGDYGETYATFNDDGAVSLRHDNSVKFETTSTGAEITGDLTLTSTDSGSADDPSLILYRNSSSPAFNDTLGEIIFRGNNATDGQTADYASITTKVSGTGNNVENGELNINVVAGGSTLEVASFNYFEVRLKKPLQLDEDVNITFEGSSSNSHETVLDVIDPTSDNTVSLPDATGTVPVFTTAPTGAIADGTNGQVLTTNGSGGLSFTTVSGGGGGGSGISAGKSIIFSMVFG